MSSLRYILFRKIKVTRNFLTSVVIGVLFVFFAVNTSKYAQNIGNIFFGQNPKLYNVNLANFFFTCAAYPLIGKPSPYAHHQLSRTYFIEGDVSAAISEAKKEIEIYPDHTATYYIIGLTYGYMNQEKDAIDAFSKYIDTHPETWAARNDKAWLQFRIGDIDGALKTIEPVATSTSLHNPWIQNTYGTLLMNKKKYKEAKDAFERAWETASLMDEESWGKAYPGNDPRIYSTGLSAMKNSIQNNQKLLDKYLRARH